MRRKQPQWSPSPMWRRPLLAPEQTVVSAALTDVATDDLASLKPVVSLAEVVDPEPTASTVAPTDMSINKAATADRDSPETPVVLASVSAAEALVLGAPLSDAAARAMRRPRVAVHV